MGGSGGMSRDAAAADASSCGGSADPACGRVYQCMLGCGGLQCFPMCCPISPLDPGCQAGLTLSWCTFTFCQASLGNPSQLHGCLQANCATQLCQCGGLSF